MQELTEYEQGILRGLVRDGLRKLDKNRLSLIRKYGDEYDPTRQDEREALLYSAYNKLGGDPARITNRKKVVGRDGLISHADCDPNDAVADLSKGGINCWICGEQLED